MQTALCGGGLFFFQCERTTKDISSKEIILMRKLSITRTKSFVGCLVSIKIYVEDAFHNEMMINGVRAALKACLAAL